MLRQRRDMQEAADAAVLGLPPPAKKTQQQYQQQQAALQPEQQQMSEQQAMDDGFPMCVRITVDKTNGACQTACATKTGCPAELKESCKCGDEAIDNLDKAAAATEEREKGAAQTNAEVRGGVSNSEADTLAGQDAEEAGRNVRDRGDGQAGRDAHHRVRVGGLPGQRGHREQGAHDLELECATSPPYCGRGPLQI